MALIFLLCPQHAVADRVMTFHAENVTRLHGVVADAKGRFHMYYSQGSGCKAVDQMAPWLHASRLKNTPWTAEGELITREYLESNDLLLKYPGSIGPTETGDQHLISVVAQRKSDSTETPLFFLTKDHVNKTKDSLVPLSIDLGRLKRVFNGSFLTPAEVNGHTYLLGQVDGTALEMWELSNTSEPNVHVRSSLLRERTWEMRAIALACFTPEKCIRLTQPLHKNDWDRLSVRNFTLNADGIPEDYSWYGTDWFDGGGDWTTYMLAKHGNEVYTIGWSTRVKRHRLGYSCAQQFTTLRRIEVREDRIVRQIPVLDGLYVTSTNVRSNPIGLPTTADCSVRLDATPSGMTPEAYRFDLQFMHLDGLDKVGWTAELRQPDFSESIALSVVYYPTAHPAKYYLEFQIHYCKEGKCNSQRTQQFSWPIDYKALGTATILTDGGLVEVFLEDGARAITEMTSSGSFPQLCLHGNGSKPVTLANSTVTTYLREEPTTHDVTSWDHTTSDDN